MSDFLESLTASAREAYSFIQAGVRQGLSINAIGSLIRGSGLSISNQALRDTVRLERAVVESSSRLKFLPLDSKPNPDSMMESLTAIRRQYSFTVKVAVPGQSFSDPGIRRVTVTTDKLLTRRQIEDAARTAVTGAQGRYGIEVSGVQIERGMKAGVAGTL